MTVISCLTSWAAGPLLVTYLFGEFVFFLFYHHVLFPRCNRRTEPEEYRDYGRDRHKLMRRLMRRMERTCQATGTAFQPALANYLREWFLPLNPFQDKDEKGHDEYLVSANGVPALPRKGDMDSFAAWAFFGKDPSELEDWMKKEMVIGYDMYQKSHGVTFAPGRTPGLKPMRLSIDDIQPSYRPLLLYMIFSCLSVLGGLFLRAAGFQRYTIASSGLRYWYRSQRHMLPLRSGRYVSEKLLPTIFFHGIAPGGPALYLPMLLGGFGRDGRALYIFENAPISFQLCPRIHTEAETVKGVLEAVNRHHGPNSIVSLLAHSFGTCQATWLLKSSIGHRIRQATLIDPVSILVSEPDVLTSFLYHRNGYAKKEKKMINKIGFVANEMFIEHYLRRHFSWYNSELWLEDIPEECKVAVCLASDDEILNAAKIKRQVEIYLDDIGGSMKGGLKASSKLELLVWDGVGHGYCVGAPRAWTQTQAIMRRQERLILKEESLKEK